MKPLLNIDLQRFVSEADLACSGIITTPSHGLPIGNGVMGGLVWNPDDSTLQVQLNRVDVFGYNSAATHVGVHEDQ